MSMRYTNIVLTVIALCLVYMCLRETASPLCASGTVPTKAGPLEVTIVGKPEFVLAGGLNDVFSKPIEVKLVRTNEDLPVEIKNYRVPVEVKDSETVPVRVESMPR